MTPMRFWVKAKASCATSLCVFYVKLFEICPKMALDWQRFMFINHVTFWHPHWYAKLKWCCTNSSKILANVSNILPVNKRKRMSEMIDAICGVLIYQSIYRDKSTETPDHYINRAINDIINTYSRHYNELGPPFAVNNSLHSSGKAFWMILEFFCGNFLSWSCRSDWC